MSSKYNLLCEKMVGNLVKETLTVLGLLITSYVALGLGTMYVIIFQHSRATFFGIEIAFLERDSDVGYAMNLFIQLIMSAVALIANISIEIGECLATNAVEAIPEIIQFDIGEFEIELQSNGMSLIAIMRMRSILLKVHDYYK